MHRTTVSVLLAACICVLLLAPGASAQYLFVPQPTNAVYFAGGYVNGHSVAGEGIEGGFVFKGGFDIGVSVVWWDAADIPDTACHYATSITAREYLLSGRVFRTARLTLYTQQGYRYQQQRFYYNLGTHLRNDFDFFLGVGLGLSLGGRSNALLLTTGCARYTGDDFSDAVGMVSAGVADRVALKDNVWFVATADADYYDKQTSVTLTGRIMYGFDH